MSLEEAFEIGRLYEPLKKIADTLTSGQKDLFVRLPALQGYWPMSIRNASGLVMEHSYGGPSLQQIGACPTGYDGNSYVPTGNGINYLYDIGSFGVTGLESSTDASIRGLTLGGWFNVLDLPPVQAGLVTKFGTATDYGYALFCRSSGVFAAAISATGSDVFSLDGGAVHEGQWQFVVMRFTPSSELAVFVDGQKTILTASIPASLNAASQNFEVGRYQGTNGYINDQWVRDVFICAAALPDDLIEEIRVTSN